MPKNRLSYILSFLIFPLLASAILLPQKQVFALTPTPTPKSTPRPPVDFTETEEKPAWINGSFNYTNEFVIETYYTENAVALVDMTGFVKRDQTWQIPIDSQVLGYLEINADANTCTYQLQLPAKPRGETNDVNNDRKRDPGVQIFAVAYWPNLIGSPFAAVDDRSEGWPDYLASILTDSENQDEIISGRLIIWSPNAFQQFPSGFGEDGLLFTGDDPITDIPAGYSIVDINAEPFEFIQKETVNIPLYEPQDIAIKDFSDLSYSQAFQKMFENVKKEYAFNGIAEKEPQWEKLYDQIAPRVEAAQENNDPEAFFIALRDFTYAFKDGHVTLSGGEIGDNIFVREIIGGYGFAVRELDDGTVIANYITPDGPAEYAGMQLGAEILEFNNTPITEAIDAILPSTAPHSTDFGMRYQQLRYLVRAPAYTKATITFQNPAQENPQQVTLEANPNEVRSFQYTSLYRDFNPNALPIEYSILDSGIGYIKINSNSDDLNLIIRLFERALKTFKNNQLPGLIIDMRTNTGGAPLGLAGYLHDQEIELGQLEYFSETTKTFEAEGPPMRFWPMQNQYRFDNTVLLVGQACFSACEIEAYGFSQVPGMIVVGEYPTGGVEAEVARGQYYLPDNMYLQIPTGRFTMQDGSIFLEGHGVYPDIVVPMTAENILSNTDIVLETAENEILKNAEGTP